MAMFPCYDCGFEVALSETVCRHCGRTGYFPNVRRAAQIDEQQELVRRYRNAIVEAHTRECVGVLLTFEQQVSSNSVAVIARSVAETQRMLTSDSELYATYYGQRGVVCQPKDVPLNEHDWDLLRSTADTFLFGDKVKDQIRFGCLSLNGYGLRNYGECCWVLKSSMVAHRASLMDENSTFFYWKHCSKIKTGIQDLPKGYISVWDTRGKLCVAKLAKKLHKNTVAADFPEILITPGSSSVDDDFIEVHVFGPMTGRTFERILVERRRRNPSQAVLAAIEEKAKRLGVDIEVL